jgi:pre-rRNA-processing protein TSR1
MTSVFFFMFLFLKCVQGWIRGREWQVNNLVHFAGVGVFQLHSAQLLADPCPTAQPRGAACAHGSGATDAPAFLQASAAETLVQSLPYDPMNAEQSHFRCVHLSPEDTEFLAACFSEAELAEADIARRSGAAAGGRGRRDDHMSAWLVDEDGVILSDFDDEEDEDDDLDGDSEDMENSECDDGVVARAGAAGGMSDDGDDDEEGEAGVFGVDDAAAAAEWRSMRQAALQDREYPDEVDVPVDISARQRFARFRFSHPPS